MKFTGSDSFSMVFLGTEWIVHRFGGAFTEQHMLIKVSLEYASEILWISMDFQWFMRRF